MCVAIDLRSTSGDQRLTPQFESRHSPVLKDSRCCGPVITTRRDWIRWMLTHLYF